jgi:hypothetical protein
MTYRRQQRRRIDRYDPKHVWKKLPHTLKTFDSFYYVSGPGNSGAAEGLSDYLNELADFLRIEFGADPNAPEPADVMAVGGLTVNKWYDRMLRRAPAVWPPI